MKKLLIKIIIMILRKMKNRMMKVQMKNYPYQIVMKKTIKKIKMNKMMENMEKITKVILMRRKKQILKKWVQIKNNLFF